MCIIVYPFWPRSIYISCISWSRSFSLTFTKACPILFKRQWYCRVSHKPPNVCLQWAPSPLPKRRASTWTQPKSTACLSRLPSSPNAWVPPRFSPRSCQPLFPTDWLSWHFLTVSFNHLTVTVYHYGARQAWAATRYNRLLWCYAV